MLVAPLEGNLAMNGRSMDDSLSPLNGNPIRCPKLRNAQPHSTDDMYWERASIIW